MASHHNRELVFGLVAPIGVDREPVLTALRDELRKVQYDLELVHVSERLKRFADDFDDHDYLKRKSSLMDAGNLMREWHRGGDAVAVLGMVRIGESRAERGVSQTILNPYAYVIDSLKHPDEVERLRSVYGPAFISIGIYEPRENRRQRMADLARTLLTEPDYSVIDQLIDRDEDEDIKYGQKVRAAFELSDFVLDLSRPKSGIDAQVWRLIRCLFGDVQATPTRHEYGMSLARMAQAKSGSLARQVGAAVVRPDGSVAAIGMNEVAKPGGGQYSEGDDDVYPRGRDVAREQDSSDLYRHKALTDLIKLLQKADELAPRNKAVDPDKLFERWWNSQDDPWLRRAFQASTIDYIRAVHAEMAAITDAARNGVDIRDCTMYTTTFPCHDCAKHIVAAGLREVIYLAPYPKSLVASLYDDSIEINVSDADHRKVHFHSFVGITPARYTDFFLMNKRERKDSRGRAVRFDAAHAKLTLPAASPDVKSVLIAETAAARAFIEKLTTYVPQRRAVRRTPKPAPRRKRNGR